jgi:hypothetical protein
MWTKNFSDVQQYLASSGAKLVKRTSKGDAYMLRTGKYALVTRADGGFQVSLFNSAASCGCGG